MIYESTPLLTTNRLILRKYTEDDLPDLYELLRDPQVNTFLPWFPAGTTEDAQRFLHERFLSQYQKPSSYSYAVCLKESGHAIGYVCLSDQESHDLGYALRKEYWRLGIMTEAAVALVRRVKEAGYPYITATHDRKNPASGMVMKRLGMTYRYSYVEQWQPKNIPVTFRMYQLNFDKDTKYTYMEYWNRYPIHFIEEIPEQDR